MKKVILFLAVFLWIQTSFAQALRIAVYQYADNPRVKNLEPLAGHLQKQLGITCSVTSFPTVHALIEAMQQNEVDLAFISTFGYLLLQASKKPSPMLPLAVLVAPRATDNYKTAFVTRSDAPLAKLEDLKQDGRTKRIAFVTKGSTSGNLVPRLLLNGIGIKEAESHFASVQYAGTHAKALDLLLADSVDIAAMGSTAWEELDAGKKAALRLLHYSGEIPLGPVLINKKIETSLQAKIGDELKTLHQTDTAALNAMKAAWSEARQATHFISIKANYYRPYLQQFGREKTLEGIIKMFIQ